ncbi:MAG TPA: SMP-30/gluconolactonase/LRE family protein, partial [Nordella sp.]|nr:SMP-30/gluconolactonase/LRE family protein [Nordella sp.]
MLRLLFAGAFISLAVIAHAQEVSVINPRALFPEGPTLTDGKLYYTEYAGHTVMRWDGEKNTQVWKLEGCGPSAVIPMGENFAVTCYDSGKLAVVTKDGKDVASYDKDDAGAPFIGPNDGVPDGAGGVYFTTSGPWESGPIVGRVIHLTADGKLSAVADDLHYANGITYGPDKRLYVNESEAGRVISFTVDADGKLSDRRLFVRLYALGEPADAYPDGIKLGPDGNFYVGEYSAGNILVVTPDGK